MPLRGPYKKISKESRDRVVQVANAGGDWKAVAEAHEISYRTAYGWLMNNGAEPRKRGGDTRSKLSPQQIETIVAWIEGNPQLTLVAIRDRIEHEMGVVVTPQTVANRLDARLITVKKVHHIPEGVNTLINKQLRRDYVANLLQAIAVNKVIIFVDETNFNIFCRRSTGRSLRGTRAVVKLPNSKGPNLHLIGAIASNGFMYWERRRGSFKKPEFKTWFRHCLHAAIATGLQLPNIVIVLDNAPAHSNAEEVIHEAEFFGVSLLRLAPYSPMLNAIEVVWSVVKARIKTSMQAGYQQASSPKANFG
jgi:transposase